jgi:hypothetical protein
MFIKKLACIAAVSASAIAPLAYAGSAHAIATPVSSANLLINGSFEDTTLTGTNQAQLTSNWETYAKINGWSATPNARIEVQRGIAGSPYAGSNLVELDSHDYSKPLSSQDPLGLYQDVATVVGQTYTLSFAHSARPNTTAENNIFDVLVGDATNVGNIFQSTISDGAGKGETVWSIFTKTFTATSQLSRVQFNYKGTRNTTGSYIDDVKLVTVPEPSAMAGIVVVGLGLVNFKKRNAYKKSLAS